MEAEERRLRRFVSQQLRGCPDISTLTQKKIRGRFLEHVGRDSLSEEDRQLLKRIVEEELLKIEDSDGSDNEPLSKKLLPKPSTSCKRKRGQEMEILEEETDKGLRELMTKKRFRVDIEGQGSSDSEIERAGKGEKEAESVREEVDTGTESEEEEGKIFSAAAKQQGKFKKSELKPGRKIEVKSDTAPRGCKATQHRAEEVDTDKEDELVSEEAAQKRQNRNKERVVESDSEQEDENKSLEEDTAEQVSEGSNKGKQMRRKRGKPRAWLQSDEEEEGQPMKKNGKDPERNGDESPRGSSGSSSDSETESKGSGGAAGRRSHCADKSKGKNSKKGQGKQKRMEPSSSEENSEEEGKLNTRAEEGKKPASGGDSDSFSLPSLEDNEEGVGGKTTLKQVKKKTKASEEADGISKGRKGEENRTVSRLKRYIALCGVRRNYKKLLDGCRSVKSQVAVLKRELEELGILGQPSIEKCKKARLKREEAQELAELDVTNIITTEGRPRRRAASPWPPAQPLASADVLYKRALGSDSDSEEGDRCGAAPRKKSSDWRNLQGIISDDGDSD